LTPRSPPRRVGILFGSLAAAALALPLGPAWAGDGKLLLTGGVSSIDGAAGGGLTPWAVTAGYATPGQQAVTASLTRLDTHDYGLSVEGVAASFGERLELSIACQDFAARASGAALGLPGLHLKQNIFGAKVRLAGDAILDSDSPVPAVALGVEAKHLDAGPLAPTLAALGAADHGIDVYLSATKLFLAQSVLVNVSVRGTKANQNGLLGFGGTASEHISLEPEISIAWLLRRDVAIGVEYRAKPDKLDPSALGAGLREDDWKDLFVAWAPNKHVSLTMAYVDLGRIVPAVQSRRQTGAYGSLQLAY
jgi:hypothetical protein